MTGGRQSPNRTWNNVDRLRAVTLGVSTAAETRRTNRQEDSNDGDDRRDETTVHYEHLPLERKSLNLSSSR